MRILVTGAAGFIGSHTVDALREAGHQVGGLDSLAPAVHAGRPGYLPAGFGLAVGDIRDAGAVRRAVAGAMWCAIRLRWSGSAWTWATCPHLPG